MENSGVVYMLRNQKTDDLACMYKVLCRVMDGLKTLCDAISSHLREQGKDLVTEQDAGKSAITFVQVSSLRLVDLCGDWGIANLGIFWATL